MSEVIFTRGTVSGHKEIRQIQIIWAHHAFKKEN